MILLRESNDEYYDVWSIFTFFGTFVCNNTTNRICNVGARHFINDFFNISSILINKEYQSIKVIMNHFLSIISDQIQ